MSGANPAPLPTLDEGEAHATACSVVVAAPSLSMIASKQAGGSIASKALIAIVRLWQLGPSALMGPTCRFDPSCSAYAIEALRRYGALKGGWLSLRRISRCHPFGGSGLDSVP